MAIQTQCEHCGFAYAAPDALAGKRVRCRNCGKTFALPMSARQEMPTEPSVSDLDEQLASLPPMPPVAHDEAPQQPQTTAEPVVSKTESRMSGGVGSAKSRMERPDIDPGMFQIAGDQQAVALRPSTPFTFPYAHDMDAWMPRIVPLLMLAWVFYMMWSWRPISEEAPTHPFWGAFFPIGLSLLLLNLVWWPIFARVMRKVAHNIKLALPDRTPIRSLCIAAIAFGFTGVFWLAGESLVTLTVGAFIGAGLAVMAAWFLYRLKDTDLIHAGVACLLAALASSAVSVGVFAGVNLVLNRSMVAMKAGGDFYASPLGPDLSWDRTIEEFVPRPHVASTKPAVPTAIITEIRPGGIITTRPATPTGEGPVATTPPVPDRTQPANPVTNPPTNPGYGPYGPTRTETPLANPLPDDSNRYLTRGTILPVSQPFTDVVYPLTDSEFMAVVSPSRNYDEREVRVYRIEPFGPVKDFVAVLSNGVLTAGYALSPDGQKFSQVTRFASGARVDVWSFRDQNLLNNVPFETRDVPSRLAGFVTDNLLLCQWLDGGYQLQAMGVMPGRDSLALYVNSNDRYSPLLGAISSGKTYPMLLVINMDPRVGENPRLSGAPTAGVPTIQVFNRTTSMANPPRLDKVTAVPMLKLPRHFPLMPTGLALYGKSVAVAFQEGTQLRVLVYTYEVGNDNKKDLADKGQAPVEWTLAADVTIPGGIAPVPPGSSTQTANRLSWLVDDLLLYGNSIISINDRKVVSTINANVVQQKMVNAKTLHLVIGQPGNLHVLQTEVRQKPKSAEE